MKTSEQSVTVAGIAFLWWKWAETALTTVISEKTVNSASNSMLKRWVFKCPNCEIEKVSLKLAIISQLVIDWKLNWLDALYMLQLLEAACADCSGEYFFKNWHRLHRLLLTAFWQLNCTCLWWMWFDDLHEVFIVLLEFFILFTGFGLAVVFLTSITSSSRAASWLCLFSFSSGGDIVCQYCRGLKDRDKLFNVEARWFIIVFGGSDKNSWIYTQIKFS